VILEGNVRRVVPGDDLDEDELTRLRDCAARCRVKIGEWIDGA